MYLNKMLRVIIMNFIKTHSLFDTVKIIYFIKTHSLFDTVKIIHFIKTLEMYLFF